MSWMECVNFIRGRRWAAWALTIIAFGPSVASTARADSNWPPAIISFTPAKAAVGQQLVIHGINFYAPISVAVGDQRVDGYFTPTDIYITIPTNAVSGFPVIVITARGSDTTSSFLTILASNETFFAGETELDSGVYYLDFGNKNFFGYYAYTDYPTIYHYDLGYLYFFDAGDGERGAYFYDFTSKHYWYTSPAMFPYIYDLTLQAWLFYFPANGVAGRYSSDPRQFYNFSTGKFFSM